MEDGSLAGEGVSSELTMVAAKALLSRVTQHDKEAMRLISLYENDPSVESALQDIYNNLALAISRARELSQTISSSSIYKLDGSGNGEGRQLVKGGILGDEHLCSILIKLSQENPKNVGLDGYAIESELDGKVLESSPKQWMESRVTTLSKSKNLSGGGDTEATWI